MSFSKGHTYIVNADNGYWYLVKQVSMKKWRATNFTHLYIHLDDNFKVGNGVGLWVVLGLDDKDNTTVRKYRSEDKTKFRKDMYDVLGTGKFQEEEF